MSTLSPAAAQRDTVARGVLALAGAAMKRWAVAWIAWRTRQATILHLESMSDRELKDIGLGRGQIPFAAASMVRVWR